MYRKSSTIDEIRLPVLRQLIEVLDLSPDNDWENIACYFHRYFSLIDINTIKQDIKKPGFSPSEHVLQILRLNLVPVSELYAFLVDYQLIEACNIIEKEYPDIILRTHPQLNLIQSPVIEPLSLNTRNFENFNNPQTNFQQLNYNMNIDKNDSASPNSIANQRKIEPQLNSFDLPQSQSNVNIVKENDTDPPLSLQNLFGIYESILPVIYEKVAKDPITNNNTSCFSFDSSLPVQFKMKGQFEIMHIKERKLTFRKKEFLEPYDFFRELKTIKNRHHNLYTAECILKNFCNPKSYALLYNFYSPSKLLTEFANQKKEMAQQQENANMRVENDFETRLVILRDIAAGLTFLHEKSDQKSSILHGNFQADSVLIFSNPHCSAKICDFTSSIEVDDSPEYDAKKLEEFNRFGLIIYLVSTWKCMDMLQCEQIHADAKKHNDLGKYLYELFSLFGLPNTVVGQTLLRMFYYLTSPTYDYRKGIRKSYDNLNKLIQDHYPRINTWQLS